MHACVVPLELLPPMLVELASVVVPLTGPVVPTSVVLAVVLVSGVPVLPVMLSLTPLVEPLALPSGPAVVGTLSVAEPVLAPVLLTLATVVLAPEVSVSRVPSSPHAAARIRSGTMGKGKKLRMPRSAAICPVDASVNLRSTDGEPAPVATRLHPQPGDDVRARAGRCGHRPPVVTASWASPA
jgi:hypothetical protein